MSYFSYISSFFSTPAKLRYLAEKTENFAQIANSQKNSFHIIEGDSIPEWCTNLIDSHIQLKSLTNQLVNEGKRDIIPIEALQALDHSQALINQLASRIQDLQFVDRIYKQSPAVFSDPAKLLTLASPDAIPSHSSVREWEINFALLKSAYEQARDDKTKQVIRFLIVNYLAKSAFLNALPRAHLPGEDLETYRDMMQLGQLSKALAQQYHRTVQQTSPGSLFDFLPIQEKFAAGQNHPARAELFCIEHPDIDLMYPISFTVMPGITSPQEITNHLVFQFEKNKEKFSKGPDGTYEFPCLIDASDQIGKYLITDQDPTKEQNYKDEFRKLKQAIDGIIGDAVEKIIEHHPEHIEQEERIKDFIQMNLAVVSKAKFKDNLSLLFQHKKIFSREDFCLNGLSPYEKSPYQNSGERHCDEKILKWIGISGISPGAVTYRQILAELTEEPSQMITEFRSGQEVSWAPKGKKNTSYFSSATDITSSQLFKNLQTFVNEKDEKMYGQNLLADLTLQMSHDLVSAIKDEDWQKIKENPALNEVTQASLYRFKEHLATAYHNRGDFRIFSQAIDCAHSELAAILTIFQPFRGEEEFKENYLTFISDFLSPPKGISVQVGLAKSAMNTFAGINATLLKKKPEALRVTDPHSYYEEIELVGRTMTVSKAIEAGREKDIDLYVAEFYHNIDIDVQHTHYTKGSVIEDIRKILPKKSPDDVLTVALDATIDVTRSQNIKELITTFEKEILSGKLNLIIFRSGQKFDMFGLDNYFGAPFYIINNGDPKWKNYSENLAQPIFHTDPLSQQYFCLMSKGSLEKVDEYKQLIFDNTRKILDLVPEKLQPKEDRDICICSFEKDVKTPFIDIRFGPEDESNGFRLLSKAEELFVSIFLKSGKITYRRGSFGFAHPNITPIQPKLRINPGIDPGEIELYKKFFDEFAASIEETEL